MEYYLVCFSHCRPPGSIKGWEPQHREPQEYSRNIQGRYLPGSLYSYHVLPIFLGYLFWAPHYSPVALGTTAVRNSSI